jgi:tRNA threonylcarbamoyladenosine biosynthesis protein TsaB
MALMLAIDCALRQINLGVLDGETGLGEMSANVGSMQSELLPKAVEDFMASLGKSIGEIELMAVTTGPGYYTGIRVGLSYACALAYSLRIKIVPVPTLRAMAFGVLDIQKNLGAASPVAPVIQAGRGSLYAAVYGMDPNGETMTLLEPSHLPDEHFFASIGVDFKDRPIIVGNNLSSYAVNKTGYRNVSPVLSMGLSVARIASEGDLADPEGVTATYLRNPY